MHLKGCFFTKLRNRKNDRLSYSKIEHLVKIIDKMYNFTIYYNSLC